jgi:uncharacterized cupredoxin-like copper-binding protein
MEGALGSMTKMRIAVCLAALTGVLAWALPASAHSTGAVVKVTAGQPSELRFTLSTKTVEHGVVTFKILNKGILSHDFSIAGKKTKLIAPGKSATLKVTLKKGKAPYKCTVPGHAAAGMKGVLVVK